MKKVTKNVMIQGTSSHVGKSVLTAALLRSLKRRGYRAAPFKAQNMALNSSVAIDGGEIGRAQAFQAEAAGVPATVDMNPILLKPTADSLSQVIIHGRVYGSMSAREYHLFKKEALRYAIESYARLERQYDIIVIEGAGSPAEVNLREGDIANMGIAEAVDSPVLLVGDIDRGGVFASIVGTMELLSAAEKERVKGFIINKFRGDKTLLAPGLEFLEERTGKRVAGVVPYFTDLLLPDEDGAAIEGRKGVHRGAASVRIAVVRLPRISNFTDFDPFRMEPGVELDFIDGPAGALDADIIIIPGSKNTIEDLLWLKGRGFGGALERHRARGGLIIGVCGGFQMLGNGIEDPHGVESGALRAEGLNLLDSTTVLRTEKSTFRVSARARLYGSEFEVEGYEIHMGETAFGGPAFSSIKERNGKGVRLSDGGVSSDGLVWGTYIHGVFDNDAFRRALLEAVRRKKGLYSVEGVSFLEQRQRAIDEIARIFEENIDMDLVMGIIGA